MENWYTHSHQASLWSMLLLLFSVFHSSLKKTLCFTAVKLTERVPPAPWIKQSFKDERKKHVYIRQRTKVKVQPSKNDNMQPNLTSVSQTRQVPLNLRGLWVGSRAQQSPEFGQDSSWWVQVKRWMRAIRNNERRHAVPTFTSTLVPLVSILLFSDFVFEEIVISVLVNLVSAFTEPYHRKFAGGDQ